MILNILNFNTNVLKFDVFMIFQDFLENEGFGHIFNIPSNVHDYGTCVHDYGTCTGLGSWSRTLPQITTLWWVDITFRFRCWFLEIPSVIHSQIWKYARKWSFLSKKDFTYKLPK